MKVTLINSTKDADLLLVFTKNTRLQMSAGSLQELSMKPRSYIDEQLSYMAHTIPSSWEMVDYVFMIEGVTRAFTHQFVRTRTGSYAQQTMRVLTVAQEGAPFSYSTGPSVLKDQKAAELYHRTMNTVNSAYLELLGMGADPEDARGILPTNIHTNIVAKFNLRTISEMARKRGSVRTQGEYREVMDAMIAAVIAVHPWAEQFLRPRLKSTVGRLKKMAEEIRSTSVAASNELAKAAEIVMEDA